MKLFDFIEESPESYHTVLTMEKELLENGFQGLSEKEIWKLEMGGKYYVVRNDSSLIAFCIPSSSWKGFRIVASHTDSPAFKIKEDGDIRVEDHYIKLNIEKYGGMLMAPWFDRPLSLAGRVMIESDGKCEKRFVNVNRDLLIIPNLAIHMNRDANKGYSYQISKDLCPLFSENMTVREFIAKELGIDPKQILGTDLYLFNHMKGTTIGAKQEFICAPRLDDLQCVYSAMEAFKGIENPNYITMLAAFDSEEVGSATMQGAGSTFLEDVMERVYLQGQLSREQYLSLLANSFFVSADNAHGVHPNFPDKSDVNHRPYLNGGVVIKYHGEGKYITDGATAAWFKNLCNQAEVPYQEYYNHSDIAGGSTLGHIAMANLSMKGVDIGLAQLAMHSPYETAGAKDTARMIQALTAFYQEI